MKNNLPPNGRVVTVQTKYMGERFGYAPPETFYVALDDDEAAIEAIKSLEGFAPSDDRIIEVSDKHLTMGSMLALKMLAGTVRQA